MNLGKINDIANQFGLEDKAIHLDDIPWVPQTDRVWFKPLRFDLTTGSWINLLRIKPGGTVNRHRHTGGKVLAYTIQGQWRYLERDWVAKEGTFVFEPPGDIHTLVVDGEEEMITLFLLDGCIHYLDENNEIIGQDDVFTKLNMYQCYCKEHHIPVQELIY